MLRHAVALIAGVALAVPTAASARMTIVYETYTPAATLFRGPQGLGGADGAFRQEAGGGGVFRPGGGSFRIAKVGRREIEGLGARAVANVLRREIAAPDEEEAASHLVAVDEIGNAFRDGPASLPTALRAPEPRPGEPGAVLSEAMRILDAEESPYGGSYASRVHFYLAPALVTSIGEGRGQDFTLDRSGRRHARRGWRGVFPGLARGGGVWLQMYHGDGGSVSARVWRAAPGRISRYLERFGGDSGRVHVMLTGAAAPPAGAPAGCGAPMACQWRLAASGATRAVLDNGPGAYHVGAQASEWLREYRAHFG